MKVFVHIGAIAIVLIASLIGYRCCESHRDAKIESTASANSAEAEWIPTEADLANRSQGVGWVFGRMIGVSDAPGSPNHSPFGASSPGHPVRGVKP